MQAYDSAAFSPPAPVAYVALVHPETNATATDVPMLIDTGADVTLLPREAARGLDLQTAPDREYELVGFDGSLSTAPVVRATIIFCGRRFRGQYLLVDQPCGILGRNILNAVPLLLDGPRLEWDIAPRR